MEGIRGLVQTLNEHLCPGTRGSVVPYARCSAGFTLLEMLIVMAIISSLSAVGFGYYRNFVRSLELDSAYNVLISDLRSAQARSMAGADNMRWGIHVVNDTLDYYEVFSTPTDYSDAGKVITATTYLPGAVIFTVPTEGLTQDIIFDKISGASTPSSVSLTFEAMTRNITIKSVGIIY